MSKHLGIIHQTGDGEQNRRRQSLLLSGRREQEVRGRTSYCVVRWALLGKRPRRGPNKRRVTTRCQGRESCGGQAEIVTETLCDGRRLIAVLFGFGGLTCPALLCSMPRGAGEQPRLASIVEGSACQVARWAEESASMALGQTFSPVQQGANARWSPPADKWTNGYTQDVWRSARWRRWRLRGAAKQLFTALWSLSDCELEA